VAPVSDSIIIEGPGVTVPLDYVPAGIYQGRRVWSVSVHIAKRLSSENLVGLNVPSFSVVVRINP
jgi:hypothetical protein